MKSSKGLVRGEYIGILLSMMRKPRLLELIKEDRTKVAYLRANQDNWRKLKVDRGSCKSRRIENQE